MEEIEEIKGIEKRLEADVARARERSQNAVDTYRAKMPELIEAEKRKARAEAGGMVNMANAEGEKESMAIASAAEKEIKLLRAKGGKNFNNAVGIVVSRL